MFIDAEYLQFSYFSHTAFLKKFIENMAAERRKPVYKYIHVMNTHTPMVVNSECGYAGGVLQNTRPALLTQSKCTLGTAVRLFEKMKMLGIYDDVLIVVHADHGGWVASRRHPQTTPQGGDNIPPAFLSLASPLIAIKAPPRSGDLKTTAALASLTDIPDSISAIMQWGTSYGGEALLDMDEKRSRERRMHLYTWQRDAWETDFTGPIYEYKITGSHYEAPWIPARVFLPPGSPEPAESPEPARP
jgi:hypothetical protein